MKRNPLKRRLLRELRQDWTRYTVMFLFLVMLISLISGFLVADHSVRSAYDEGFTKYNIEDGHLAFDKAPPQSVLEELEAQAGIILYPLSYVEESPAGSSHTIRIYPDRTDVNLPCLMSGSMPASAEEIALDRMYAQNNSIEVGDTLTVRGRALTVSGLISLADYSCLFESNADMMFDAVNFCVAVMTEEGFSSLGTAHLHYNYAWQYDSAPSDDVAAAAASDDLLDTLQTILTDYDAAIVQDQIDALTKHAEELTALAMAGDTDALQELNDLQAQLEDEDDTSWLDDSEILGMDDYLPRYLNKAINFTGEDMGSDKTMFLLFDYIITVILAFVFAVTASNTITQEATVIGTLRASGYSRGELLRHYMVLPVAVTLLAAIIGNLLGYLVLQPYFVALYYNSYSLCSYVTLWNAEAFLDTTVIPLILMFVINLLVVSRKLRLSPLQFLRRELSRRSSKRALRLPGGIPFLHRFRIRILLQNGSTYLTLIAGIFFASFVAIFGFMFMPLLQDYADLVRQSQLAEYQYLVIDQAETEDPDAEAYCVTSLESTDTRYMVDDITVYGITEGSRYVSAELPAGQVLVSNGMADKFGLSAGDTLTLKDPYSSKTYRFTVGGSYIYDAAMAVFMPREDYLEAFGKDSNYFTGWFSDRVLTDLQEDDIAAVITVSDLSKIATQMQVSMGDFMKLFRYFGGIMFLLMMFLLTKLILEKNSQSISLVKILGFSDGEISRLYLVMTSIVVLAGLLISIPATDGLLRWIFHSYLYTAMTGYIPYMVRPSCYLLTVGMGIVSYGLVSLVMLRKIRGISKSEALKNQE